jgi:hypothetical protein
LPQLTLCTLTNIQEPGGTDHIVPVPRSTQEAYLLLEAAHADRGIILARNSLTRQIIHHNTLVLQYNRMVLEQAQDDLHATDRFVGEVCFLIRKVARALHMHMQCSKITCRLHHVCTRYSRAAQSTNHLL